MAASGAVSPVQLLRDGTAQATGQAAIAEAARLMEDGKVVAIPTDTVYGLAASLRSPAALQEIFRLKGRSGQKSLPVLLADAATATRLIDVAAPGDRGDPDDPDWLLEFALRYWPGALTMALPAAPGLPPEVLAGDGTVGLRVPDSVIAREVIRRSGGALAVTSANRSGHPPALDARTVREQLGDAGLRWVLDGGPGIAGVPSTVVGRDGDRLVVHRAGAIDSVSLERTWAVLRAVRAGGAG